MMSMKWTFSLTSLITILALAFVAPYTMAADGGPTVTISTADDGAAAGNQVYLRDDADINADGTLDDPLHPTSPATDPTLEDPAVLTDDVVIITVEFSAPVAFNYTSGTPVTEGTDAFDPEVDVMIRIFDKDNKIITVPSATPIRWAQISGTKYQAAITNAEYASAVTDESPALNVLYTMDVADIDTGTDGDQAFDAQMSKVVISIAADVATAIGGGDTHSKGNQAASVYEFSIVATDMDAPSVSAIALAEGSTPLSGATARVKITLSEDPKEFKKDHVVVTEAAITAFDKVDNKTYIVTIAPNYAKTDDVQVKVKLFEDLFGNKSAMVDSGDNKDFTKIQKFMVAGSKVAAKPAGTAGTEVGIDNDYRIPAGGFLIVARDDGEGTGDGKDEDSNMERTDSTYIQWPGGEKQSDADIALRKPHLRTYNMVKAGLLDLESFLLQGGTIDLKSAHKVAISEIMWATDGGSANRQWIEIMNMDTASVTTKDYKLVFYGGSETPPAMVDGKLPAGVADRIGNIYKGAYWSVVGKGQPGRTDGIIERKIADAEIDIEVVGTTPLISMQRKKMTDGMYADGTMESSWMASSRPAQNFVEASRGLLVGTPGTSPLVAAPAPAPEPTPVVVPVAAADEIMISEIMVDTDDGRLPQWIELTYSGMATASLEGWEMVIDNAIDADVLGKGNAITVSLGSVMVDVSKNAGNMGMGQSVLVVAWEAARHSDNIPEARVIDLASQLGQTRRYQLLSYNAFRITLVPPKQQAIAAFGDIAGNLHEDWDIPMSEGSARSSLIRYDMLADGTATMGTDANGWVLASDTDLATGPESYYGDDEDSSTPGQHAGGPLPVELSHFRPARDKQTGAVVITWATQSELNNAGFFIKRSQQRDGEFKVINATMVPGAGTTSEKQFYTYTDTTAQPNVVYYYQIEDVSLDGNRQLLTRGTRLKGHIGAAGKATTTWGELKTSHE